MNSCDLILVRHTEVAARFQGVCYGQSDVELSSKGIEQCKSLASRLAELKPTVIFHSDLKRTRTLAEMLAKQTGAPLSCCDALRERDFGGWELQRWDDIYSSANGNIDRLMTEPASFRPPGGETTFEMRDRVIQWFRSLPHDGLVVAITHGGPIAALIGFFEGLPVKDWATRIPVQGNSVRVKRVAGACGTGRVTNKYLTMTAK